MISDDQKQITYLLDPDRKWSDGTPITAHDVVWTLENVGKEGVYYSGYTNTIEKVEATDAALLRSAGLLGLHTAPASSPASSRSTSGG